MKVNLGKVMDNELNPFRLNKLISDIEKMMIRVPDTKEQDTVYRTKENELTASLNMTDAAINHATASVTAHATTMDIWSGSNHKTMSGGAVTVTDVVDAPQAGATRWMRANAAHTITNGGAITVQGGGNYLCEDGDWMLWFAKTISTFHVLIFPVDGNPVVTPTPDALHTGGTVQVKYVQDGVADTTASAIPIDASIPQSNEGEETFSLTITPTHASNILRFECMCSLSHSTANEWMVISMFKDSETDATAAQTNYETTATADTQVHLTYEEAAGGTSAQTWTIRYGSHSGATTSINGQLGLVQFSWFRITEIKV